MTYRIGEMRICPLKVWDGGKILLPRRNRAIRLNE
jgi:hypothetical protein